VSYRIVKTICVLGHEEKSSETRLGMIGGIA